MMVRPAPETLLRADQDWSGSRVAVLGLGRSGAAASRLLRARGVRVTGIDDRDAEELDSVVAELRHHVQQWCLGGALPSWTETDALVVSPGVPTDHPALVAAREARIEVLGELELASRLVAGPLVVVTGTNGKSTTVSLVHAMLQSAGRRSRLVGNIGIAMSDEVSSLSDDEIVVVEASSFQLEWIDSLHPRVAAVLNIAPDHLNRYADFEAYAAAKRNLLRNLQANDLFVFPHFSRRLREWSESSPARALPFGLELPAGTEGVTVEDGGVVVRRASHSSRLFAVDDIPLLGEHNLLNVLAAVALVEVFDLDPDAMARAVRRFEALDHRAVDVPSADGVRWIDDSKATNVNAAVATARGVDPLGVWLLGGSGKGEDYTPLRDAAGRARHVICFGGEASAILAAVEGATEVSSAENLGQALTVAAEVVESGEAVLLSPACASFDEFDSFEQRGDFFAAWVRDHRGGVQ